MIPVTPIKLIEMDHHEKASYSTVEQVRRPRRRRRAAPGRAGRGAAGGPRGRGLAPGGQRRGRSNPRWTPATMAWRGLQALESVYQRVLTRMTGVTQFEAHRNCLAAEQHESMTHSLRYFLFSRFH